MRRRIFEEMILKKRTESRKAGKQESRKAGKQENKKIEI
jgi:hypothetical protein